MAELFGAPNGIIASEELLQKGMLANALNEKTMAEISEIPGKIELTKQTAWHQQQAGNLSNIQANTAAVALQQALRRPRRKIVQLGKLLSNSPTSRNR